MRPGPRGDLLRFLLLLDGHPGAAAPGFPWSSTTPGSTPPATTSLNWVPWSSSRRSRSPMRPIIRGVVWPASGSPASSRSRSWSSLPGKGLASARRSSTSSGRSSPEDGIVFCHSGALTYAFGFLWLRRLPHAARGTGDDQDAAALKKRVQEFAQGTAAPLVSSSTTLRSPPLSTLLDDQKSGFEKTQGPHAATTPRSSCFRVPRAPNP